MSTPARKAASATNPPYFIADDLALDFLNTVIRVDSNPIEYLNDDAQVLDWLQRARVPVETAKRSPPGQRGALLAAALALRETARELLSSRKAGRAGDPSVLNRVLARGSTHHELVWKRTRAPECIQRRRMTKPEDFLVPVAEAIAQLLVEGNMALVRKCENTDCTLWFYDRTKSHRRRWCSMAVCGNRMKVAAFRARHRRE